MGKTKVDKVLDALDEVEMSELANFRQKSTGLPMVIWVSEKGGARHGPRIKVCKTHGSRMDVHNMVTVSISNEPEVIAGKGLKAEDMALIKKFVKRNTKVLLDYWEGKINTLGFTKGFTKGLREIAPGRYYL